MVVWDDGGDAPDGTGFSFSSLDCRSAEDQIDQQQEGDKRPAKRTRVYFHLKSTIYFLILQLSRFGPFALFFFLVLKAPPRSSR